MESWLQKIKSHFALIGFPEDRGIRRNNGRPGAAQGPSEIRNHLDKAGLKKWGLVDLGDAPPAETLLERQRLLGSMVRVCLENGVFPIVLGGGHETAFGHYLGYRFPSPPPPLSLQDISPDKRGSPPPRGEGSLHILSIDAHYDCKPLIDGEGHSGSPFRQMIEAGLPGENLTAFGIQRSCNSGPNVEFAIEKKVQTFFLEEIRKEGIKSSLKKVLEKIQAPLYVTIDLDSMRGNEFPATSAALKMKDGFTIKEMESLIGLVAPYPQLTSLDLCEFSPPYDLNGTSARAVAGMIHQFLSLRSEEAK